MRLLPKLTLGILAASAVPLGIAGLTAASLSAQALRRSIEADHGALAVNAADSVSRHFSRIETELATYPQLVDLEGATPDLASGVLHLAYRAHEDFAVVSLLDERGAERVGSAYVSDPRAARD